jgi:protein-disulfide isomerase
VSSGDDREGRREERAPNEAGTAGEERRKRLLQLAAAGVFVVIIIVVVVIVVAGSGGDSGDSAGGNASGLVEKAQVKELLDGIPQSAAVLGETNAPVKLFEYGDLQCPFCKAYSEEVLPQLIENQVREGEVSIDFRNYIIIGPQSIPAGEAALAAGAQGKGWSFIETWYRNQGEENSGYATDAYIESMAEYVGVPDLARWKREWKGGKYRKQVEATTRQAEKLRLGGTPTFAIEGPHSKGLELLGTPETIAQLEAAIEKAA